MSEYAKVRILDVPYHGDRVYEYYIPATLGESVSVGSFVSVGFGRGNRKCSAVVTAVSDEPESDREHKAIISVSMESPVLSSEELALCRFMCDYTLCTFGEAVKTVVPAAAMSKLNFYYTAVGDISSAKGKKLNEKTLLLYNFVKQRGRASAAAIRQEYGADAPAMTAALIKSGFLEREAEIKESTNVKYETVATLAVSREEAERAAEKSTRSPLQAALIRELIERGTADATALFECVGANAKVQLSTLEKKGIVKLTKKEIYRNPYLSAVDGEDVYENTPLTEEQEQAVETLSSLAASGEAKAALLHGITGSGKTRVIKAMIDKVTETGRGVIILVPEISLTPQTVGIFCACYGERVSVLHSALSQGERYDAWRRIRRGDSDIVIGTRSAVFAPVKNLGMIVIDEEQEHTYKSDTDPKYLAHDIARYRCGKSSALMLLASATPSLNSYYKAKSGIYTLVELNHRYGEAKLPDVIVSDMRLDRDAGSSSPVGMALYDKLLETKKDGEQAIVFLNRRGYNSAVSCRVCGEAIKCPHCSVALTYHTYGALGKTDTPSDYFRRRVERGTLSCHYCGYKTSVPQKCPTCEAEHFRFMGCGTQQAEEELQNLIPGIRVMRMDMDTTGTKQAFDIILEGFRQGKADVLLGTQMVTKGHDFPGVTLVGVLNADASLYLDDYRAAERTFAMLTQVVGRAGRASNKGMAVIQTCNPDSPVIKMAASQNYKAFYESEINVRKALMFPPFCDIAVINISSGDEALLSASSKAVAERLRELLSGEYSDVEAEVYGPFEAPVYKIQNSFRMRMIIKCRLGKRSRSLIAQLLREVGMRATRKVTVTADLNPSGL